MEITLNQESVVNKRTGEVEKTSEYVENLRAIEAEIAHMDDEIASVKTDLKKLREDREHKVAELRSAIREGQVLPLLEQGEAA